MTTTSSTSSTSSSSSSTSSSSTTTSTTVDYFERFLLLNVSGLTENVSIAADFQLENFTHFLIYSVSELEEQTTPTALAIFDSNASVTLVKFIDLDLDPQQLGGNVSFLEPNEPNAPLYRYVLYLANSPQGDGRLEAGLWPRRSMSLYSKGCRSNNNGNNNRTYI